MQTLITATFPLVNTGRRNTPAPRISVLVDHVVALTETGSDLEHTRLSLVSGDQPVVAATHAEVLATLQAVRQLRYQDGARRLLADMYPERDDRPIDVDDRVRVKAMGRHHQRRGVVVSILLGGDREVALEGVDGIVRLPVADLERVAS